ncbi:hypothetical protein DKX38_010275 [Salix brachista]|uniref:Uncharacterized protein n=1 Tax=Salix brachista TaxID=2182728 RepID=A0A5N5MCP7_9ROSI|nr:hypothetical protein DKX38_010275 [Salix brachista]
MIFLIILYSCYLVDTDRVCSHVVVVSSLSLLLWENVIGTGIYLFIMDTSLESAIHSLLLLWSEACASEEITAVAASVIGECTTKVFARHGAKVVGSSIQDESGHSLAKVLGPSSSSYVHCDVTDEAQVRNAVSTAVTTYEAHVSGHNLFKDGGFTIQNPSFRMFQHPEESSSTALQIYETGNPL